MRKSKIITCCFTKKKLFLSFCFKHKDTLEINKSILQKGKLLKINFKNQKTKKKKSNTKTK